MKSGYHRSLALAVRVWENVATSTTNNNINMYMCNFEMKKKYEKNIDLKKNAVSSHLIEVFVGDP